MKSVWTHLPVEHGCPACTGLFVGVRVGLSLLPVWMSLAVVVAAIVAAVAASALLLLLLLLLCCCCCSCCYLRKDAVIQDAPVSKCEIFITCVNISRSYWGLCFCCGPSTKLLMQTDLSFCLSVLSHLKQIHLLHVLLCSSWWICTWNSLIFFSISFGVLNVWLRSCSHWWWSPNVN